MHHTTITQKHSPFVAERGFSVNNAVETTDRGSLSQRSIVTICVVKEKVCVFGSCNAL